MVDSDGCLQFISTQHTGFHSDSRATVQRSNFCSRRAPSHICAVNPSVLTSLMTVYVIHQSQSAAWVLARAEGTASGCRRIQTVSSSTYVKMHHEKMQGSAAPSSPASAIEQRTGRHTRFARSCSTQARFMAASLSRPGGYATKLSLWKPASSGSQRHNSSCKI